MTSPTAVLERFKEAKDVPPSQLLALVKRSFNGHPTYKFYPGVPEPHLFTYPASSFSVNMTDLKILLRNGLTRIQSNDPSKITVYFAGEEPEESPDWKKIDWFQMGQDAFKAGKPAAPARDPILMQKLKDFGSSIGMGPARYALQEWERGWTRANLDAPVP
jgi:hypothetical protein